MSPLQLSGGELVGVIGHTGSGKSTLIQHFNGLLPPTSGQILLDGEDIWADKAKLRSVRFRVGLCFQYPEYQLLEAYLLHLEGEDDQASEILERYQNKSFHHNELELAGIYLYLCTQTGLYRDKEQALRKVQNFQMQKEDSFILLKLVFEMDHTLSPSKKIFLMEELFERGCTSPFSVSGSMEPYLCRYVSAASN